MVLAKIKRMVQKYELFVLTSSISFPMQIIIYKLIKAFCPVSLYMFHPPPSARFWACTSCSPQCLQKRRMLISFASGCPPQFWGFEVWSQRTLQMFDKAEPLNSRIVSYSHYDPTTWGQSLTPNIFRPALRCVFPPALCLAAGSWPGLQSWRHGEVQEGPLSNEPGNSCPSTPLTSSLQGPKDKSKNMIFWINVVFRCLAYASDLIDSQLSCDYVNVSHIHIGKSSRGSIAKAD